MEKIINYWHSILDMPKMDVDWHKNDILDELKELEEADGLIHKWSELSDIVYTYTCARWSGHKTIECPLNKICFFVGLFYMLPKYTLRWKFYRVLGRKINKNIKITEVRNPEKIEKLSVIAQKHNIAPEQLINEAKKLKKKWIFLK